MKKLINYMFLLLSFVFLSSFVSAAMDPELKECVQRGYGYSINETGEYCILPDGNSCDIKDFNSRACGIKYIIKDYCVEDGVFVWDKNKCCKGLESYLEPNTDGQAVCKELTGKEKVEKIFKTGIILFAVIMALVMFFIGFAIWKFFKKLQH